MEGGSNFGAIKCNTQVKLKWMEGIGSDLDVEANPQVQGAGHSTSAPKIVSLRQKSVEETANAEMHPESMTMLAAMQRACERSNGQNDGEHHKRRRMV